MSIRLMRGNSASIARCACFCFLTVGQLVQAAEVDLETSYFRDSRATALVILRNDDEPRGYATVGIECVFDLAGRPVGAARAEISDLQYRQHTAARLSTRVDGDSFDHASCRIMEAKIKTAPR